MGSRTELAVGRKHRPIGQLRHSGTKFKFGQLRHSRTKFKFGQFRHAVRHNSGESGLNITKRDLSECNYPGLYIPQRDAESRHAGIHYPRVDIAGCDDAGLDLAKWHSEYHHPRLDIAEWHAEHDDSGIYFAQWDSQYNDPWIDFAANHASG